MIHHHLFKTIFVLLLGFFTIPQAHALSIDDVRFGVHPEKTRMVLDMSAVSDFRAFTLSDPYRLVIDLPTFEWRASQGQSFDKAGIKGIRHGHLQNGISRVVFDFDAPIAVKNSFFLPAYADRSNRLVVDFAKTDMETFLKFKGQSFGTLTLDNNSYAQDTNTPSRTASSNVAPVPPKKKAQKKPLVIIDPGHGGVDPGAVSKNNVYEKTVVLKLAHELKNQLLSTGKYRVMMTREDDTFIKLSDRVRFARKYEGDLFISIHADSLPKSNARGASIYTLSEKASDAQTARLAARENKADLIAGIDLSVEDKQVADILVDLAMRDTMNQSNFLANTMVDTFKARGVRLLERPHRYAGFAVLKAPDIPSILVEAGFLSNAQEAKLLSRESHRKKIAASLKDGIEAFFKVSEENKRS